MSIWRNVELFPRVKYLCFRFIIHRCERNLYQRKHVSADINSIKVFRPPAAGGYDSNINWLLLSSSAWVRPARTSSRRASAASPFRQFQWWPTSTTARYQPSPGPSTEAPGSTRSVRSDPSMLSIFENFSLQFVKKVKLKCCYSGIF